MKNSASSRLIRVRSTVLAFMAVPSTLAEATGDAAG